MPRRMRLRRGGIPPRGRPRGPRALQRVSDIRFVASLVPDKLYAKLKYVDHITLNPGVAGLGANYVYNASSIYDPDTTGVGHQPMAHDNAANLYHHYTVLRSRIKATFYAPTAGAGDQMTGMCGIALRANATVSTDARVYLEGKGGKGKALSNFNAGQATRVVSRTFNAPKFFGLRDAKAVIGDDRFTTLFGNDPNDSTYFHLFLSTMDGSTDMGACKVVVEIEYDVAFTERKSLALS